MINIKIVLLLSLAAYVSCGGGDKPPILDEGREVFSDEDETDAPLTLIGEPSVPLNEEKPTREDSQDEGYRLSNPSEPLNEVVQYNDTDVQYFNMDVNGFNMSTIYNSVSGDAVYNVGDLSVELKDNELLINGIQMPGINETLMNISGQNLINANIKLQFPTTSSEQEPANANIPEQGVDTSELHSTTSDTPRRWIFCSHGIQCMQSNNYGNNTENAAFTVDGVPLSIQNDIISIDGKIVQGFNASMRSFVIEYDAGVLNVNGIRQPEYDGIRGSGTWTSF